MIKKYTNNEGWTYVLREDGRYHSIQSTNVRREGDKYIVTGWYPLIYTKELAEKYLTPIKD